MKYCRFLLFLLFFMSFSVWSLTERHLIIISYGDKPKALLGQTPAEINSDVQNQNYAKQISNLLLTYGFDNRTIAGVFVAPDKNTKNVAKMISKIGLFSKNKIHVDKRLAEPSERQQITLSNRELRKKVLAVYDEVESKYQNGHVLFITPGRPAMELIDGLIHSKVELRRAQAYMLPLVKREIT